MAGHTEPQGEPHGAHHPNYKTIYFTLLGLLVISVVGPFFGIVWVTLVTAFGIALVKASKVKVFTMRDIDELGMRAVMEKSLKVATYGTAGFVTSFDMDVVDPSEAPGVGTPVRGGLSYREAHLDARLQHYHREAGPRGTRPGPPSSTCRFRCRRAFREDGPSLQAAPFAAHPSS